MSGLSKEDIWQVADQLDAEGKNPTLQAVRDALGRGSFSTIHAAMQDWKAQRRIKPVEEQDPPPERVQNTLAAASKQIWHEAKTAAEQRFDSERKELAGDRDDARLQAQEALALADEMSNKVDVLAERVNALEETEKLAESLKADNNRLSAALDEVRSEAERARGFFREEVERLRSDLAAATERAVSAEARLSAYQEQQEKGHHDSEQDKDSDA